MSSMLKIVAQEVVATLAELPVAVPQKRPEVLQSRTYKIKTPQSEHALYVTISAIESKGRQVPYELFINCKDARHHQWTVALTRVISAIFRTTEDCTFIVDELKSVFTPEGGYWRHGRYIPSLVAEIGDVIKQELETMGLIEAARPVVAGKSICPKCNAPALVMLDGCEECHECGYSRCGG